MWGLVKVRVLLRALQLRAAEERDRQAEELRDAADLKGLAGLDDDE